MTAPEVTSPHSGFTYPMVTREQAIEADRMSDGYSSDEDVNALALTIVALYDQLGQTFRWEAGPAAENDRLTAELLRVDAERQALRSCIVRLRDGWVAVCTDEGIWRWKRKRPETRPDKPEPMSEEEQAVMSR